MSGSDVLMVLIHRTILRTDSAVAMISGQTGSVWDQLFYDIWSFSIVSQNWSRVRQSYDANFFVPSIYAFKYVLKCNLQLHFLIEMNFYNIINIHAFYAYWIYLLCIIFIVHYRMDAIFNMFIILIMVFTSVGAYVMLFLLQRCY